MPINWWPRPLTIIAYASAYDDAYKEAVRYNSWHGKPLLRKRNNVWQVLV